MMPQPNDFSLHPQLAADTDVVGDLALCRVLAMRDGNFPWIILVPRVAAAVEILDLSEADQAGLMREVAQLARALKEATGCDKLNIAALGNVVPQLHVHIIARRVGDAAWPKPVWGHAPPATVDDVAFADLIAALRRRVHVV